MKQTQLLPFKLIERRILLIRGERVMVDTDLAMLYGVETKRLKEQVKRNSGRFPADFMFELNAKEKMEVVANCGPPQKTQGTLPICLLYFPNMGFSC